MHGFSAKYSYMQYKRSGSPHVHNAMHSLLSLCPMHVLLLCSIGSTVEVLTDDSDALKGIYFQDKEMKSVFAAYPELSFIDAMYNY